MSKQLIIVSGAPHSGRTTWINKNYGSSDYVIIDAGTYPNLYVKSVKNNTPKLFEDTIEDSRIWCLEKVRLLMEGEKPTQTQQEEQQDEQQEKQETQETQQEKQETQETQQEEQQETQQEEQQETRALRIVLNLIACRPDRWREFIQLAIKNEYEIIFKFPTNKHLFYSTRHNTSTEQARFIESKVISRFPKDKKEVYKKNDDGEDITDTVETKESSLLRHIIMEVESAYAFYLQNRRFFTSREELLKKINEHYKNAIIGDIKRAEKKLRDAEKEAEKKAKKEEKLMKEQNAQVEQEEDTNEVDGKVQELA